MIIMSLLSTEEGCNEKQYSITAPPLCPSSVLRRDVMKNSTALLRPPGHSSPYYNVITARPSSGQRKLHLPQDRLCTPLVAFCPLGMPRPPVYGIPLGQNATLGAHNPSFCRCNFHYPSERGAVIPHCKVLQSHE